MWAQLSENVDDNATDSSLNMPAAVLGAHD